MPPAAGAEIRNQVSATYLSGTTERYETVYSNTVTTRVAAVAGFTLEADQTRTALAGQQLVFPHVLVNTGNTPLSVALVAANLAGDDYDFQDLRIFLDTNGNGQIDPGEPEINSAALAVGERVHLILSVRVPAQLASGQQASVQLSGNAAGTSASVRDTARVGIAAQLLVSKGVDLSEALPGDVLRYTLQLHNSGNEPSLPIDYQLDGSPRQGVILRDRIPANTVFNAVENTGAGLLLYHQTGDAEHSYRSQAPAAADIDAVAFAYPALAADERRLAAFSVRIGPLASGALLNTAIGFDALSGAPRQQSSNPVRTQLPVQQGLLQYYPDGGFSSPTTFGLAGSPLYLQAAAGICNLDASVVETVPVTLSAQGSGDIESGFVLTETSAGSGVFQLLEIPTRLVPEFPRIVNDGLMQVVRNDVITATITCQGQVLRSTLLVDPAGLVFDSRSGALIAGARVQLLRINADGSETPAEVRDFNGQIAPSSVVTGADGRFQFPLVSPGNYRLLVTPPSDYIGPSTVAPSNLPPGFRISDGSYGRVFTVSPITGPIFIDYPLDRQSDVPKGGVVGFSLEKIADRSNVNVLAGEQVTYTLTLNNGTGAALSAVRIDDLLPAGFRLVPGSVQLDDGPLADPSGSPGPALSFTLPNFAIGERRVLRYSVTVSVTAPQGPARNLAVATAAEGSSNRAVATVTIDRDVFSDEALLLGKVFIDCDRNRVQDPEELGIPGVRLYLDDGSFAITDVEGKYSFYGLSPKTHGLKLDPISLPKGAILRTSGNRNGGDAASLFVDLHNGELHRADFIEGSCSAEVVADVKERRARGEVFFSEIDRPLDSQINTETLQVDPRSRPASGVRTADGNLAAFQPLLTDRPKPKLNDLSQSVQPRLAAIALDQLLPQQAASAVGFMDLKDGQAVLGRELNVRLLGPAGSRLRLQVNGEWQDENRVGQKAVMASRQLQAWEYVAVRLQPGTNTLIAEVVDSFGNPRGAQQIQLRAPAELGQIQWLLPPEGAVADGQTPARLMVRVQDAEGLAIGARTPVTLEASAGRIDATDLNPKEPGVQIFVEGGEALVNFIPPATPGEARLRASSGILSSEQLLPFKPHLRPLVAIGVIEGAIGLQQLSAEDLATVTPADGFQREIKELDGSDSSGAGVRGRLFLKGKVRGDRLLTLAYDSDKDTQDQLFRDIAPDRFYPVYGDSGIKGFDAQSTSSLYLRIDQGRSYVLYGDFNSGSGYQVDGGAASSQGQSASLERRLANSQRSLTGLRGHYERGDVSVNLFAAHDRRRQIVREIRGQGTSGPYPLNLREVLRNSEKVEIITRDRQQPSLIREARLLTRFADYSLDALDGSLLFTRAVPSVDEALNPIFIRVSLEVDSGGERFWVYGGDGQYRVTDQLEVGANVLRDEAPGAESSLYGATAIYRPNANSSVVAEFAQSDTTAKGSGQAMRLEAVQRSGKVDARFFVSQADADFDNQQSAVSAGRTEAGFKARVQLNEKLSIGGEGLYSKTDAEVTTQDETRGVLAYAEYAFSQQFALQVGGRRVVTESATAGASGDATTLRIKPSFIPAVFHGAALIYGEYEQDIQDSDQRVLAVGGSYQMASKGRAYLRHEFISQINGPFDLTNPGRQHNQTVVGLDYNYLDNASVFSEYRLRDSLSAREGEAALGLRNQWQVGKLRLQTNFERIQPMAESQQKSTALGLSAEYLTDALSKLHGRIELREGRDERSLLNSLGYARKINADWTFLARNIVSWGERGDAEILRDRLRLGTAYRDTDTNRWMWLNRYELRLDHDDSIQSRRQAHVLSTAVNWHPARPYTLSGRYAAKHVRESNANSGGDSFGQLLSGRAVVDLSERVDAGIAASALGDGNFSELRYGLGLEMGYLLNSNLWLSAGHNWLGYQDNDLNDVDYTRRGAYLRLRFKFDEDFFQWLE